MHRTLNSLLCALAIISLSAVGLLKLQQTPPALTADHYDFQFGELSQHQRATHIFRIRNSGGKPLRIGHAKASCSCSKVSVSSNLMKPGEEAELRVELTMPDHNVRAEIALETSDPIRPVTGFHVKALARPLLDLATRDIDFGTIRYGEASEPLDIEVYSKYPDQVVALVEDINGGIPVRCALHAKDDRQWIRLAVPPRGPAGALTSTLVVSLRSRPEAVVRISIRGTISAAIRPQPGYAWLGLISQQPTVQTIDLGSKETLDSMDLRIARMSPGIAKWITARLVEEQSRLVLRISAHGLPREPRPGMLAGTIQLQFKEGDAWVPIHIPIRLCVPAAL